MPSPLSKIADDNKEPKDPRVYELAKSEFETEKANVGLAQKIYNRSKIKYEEGVGSSFELTSALTDLYTAQSTYLQSTYKLITAQINLEKALGQYN